MANHLTAADLARFLRSRASVNAQIAADFVDEYPDHPDVAWCVDRLEELARAAGLELRSEVQLDDLDGHLGIYWHDWIEAVPNHSAANSLFPVLGVLADSPSRFRPASCKPGAWYNVLDGTQTFLHRFLPAWTAILVRRLRRAHVSA